MGAVFFFYLIDLCGGPEGRFHGRQTMVPGMVALLLGSVGAAWSMGAMPEGERASVGPRTGAVTQVSVVREIANVRRGERARVQGEVVAVLDANRFRLADRTGSIPVVLSWSGSPVLTGGERVVVEGVVHDELAFGLSRPEILATSLELPGGVTLSFAEPGEAGSAAVGSAAPGEAVEVTPIRQVRRGQSATVRGRVERILDTDEFRLVDESGSIRVYIGGTNRLDVAVGETVVVQGTRDDDPWPFPAEFYASSIQREGGASVQLSGGNITNEVGRVFELQEPRFDAAPAPAQPEVTNRPVQPMVRVADVRRGQSVHLRGTVERIRDTDEFILRDDSGSIRVYIGWRNAMPVGPGEVVTVFGVADDDVFPGLRPEIYADRIVTADGRTVTLLRGGDQE
jgi:uncharacterized protein YdeI (BOF family)